MIEQGSKYCTSPYCTNLARKGRKICEKCRMRKHQKDNPLAYTFNCLKQNAKRRRVPFALSIKEWKQFCDVTNYLKLRGTFAQDMTVDRIVDSLGYVAGNIQMITRAENSKKQARDRKKRLFSVDSGPGDCPF